MVAPSVIEHILDLARWAPSGDNTQPWRFEVLNAAHVVIHGFDTRSHCVYDLDGHPSQIALGALLETVAIAATSHGLAADIQRRPLSPDDGPLFDVHLESKPGIVLDPLVSFIPKRSVQRRNMARRVLDPAHKQLLEISAGPHHSLSWMEGGERLNIAKLMFDNAYLRLTLPEAYPVHRSIIEWDAQFSEDRVPDQALGLDTMTLKLMRWAMQSWDRVDFLNTYLAGHLLPRIEMDLLPGIFCGAHFALVAQQKPETLDHYVSAGRAVQRVWLTATSLGLGLQPELTPLIFARYVREGVRFTESPKATVLADRLAKRLGKILLNNAPRTAFMGRVGYSPFANARSLRLSLERLRTPVGRLG